MMNTSARNSFSEESRSITKSISKIFSPRKTREVQLDEVIDIDKNLTLYNDKQLSILNPKTLYQTSPFSFKTQLIRSNRNITLSILNQGQNLDLFHPETIKELRRSGKTLIHVGLVILGIKGLSRKDLGTKVLALLLDKSWKTNMGKAILAGIEIDMNNNTGLFYFTPDILKSITSVNNLKIGLQTKGYEDYIGDNLVLSIGILARATNRPGAQYKLNIESFIKTIASQGIKMINPIKYNAEDLAGLEWNLSHHIESTTKTISPTDNLVYQKASGDYVVRFTDYTPITNQELDSDEESIATNLTT